MKATNSDKLISIAKTFNKVSRDCREEFMETLETIDGELADEIKTKMFVFADIIILDDKAIQETLKKIDHRDLVLALRNSGQKAVEAITRNMSQGAFEELKKDMFELYSYSAPSEEEVEGAKIKLVGVIRQLEEHREIII